MKRYADYLNEYQEQRAIELNKSTSLADIKNDIQSLCVYIISNFSKDNGISEKPFEPSFKRKFITALTAYSDNEKDLFLSAFHTIKMN